MPSGISSFERAGWFNTTLLKKNFKRFWPIWAVYAAVLFVMLPMELLSAAYRSTSSAYITRQALDIAWNALRSAPFLGVIFGVVTAMALFSYLMDSRACQTIHSLPIRREGLFLTNWVSGLGFFLLPNLAVALITLAAGAALGAGQTFSLQILVWLAVETAVPMFFFCFALFCAMFTGNLLALPIFYGILNGLVMGVGSLVAAILSKLLVGYVESTFLDSDFARWCTPVFEMNYLLCEENWDSCLAVVCYCVVLGAAFTAAALAVYRLRQLERAGDLVTVGWVRPVFQYGFGICLGMCLGLFLYDELFYGFDELLLIALIAGMAVVGAFAGRMLLKKTLRVFAEGWKGVAVMAAVLALVLVGAKADFFGYQRWTPDPDRVTGLRFSASSSYPEDDGGYLNMYTEDPDFIRSVVDFHGALVEDLDLISGRGEAALWAMNSGEETCREVYLRLYYTMDSGETVARRYTAVPITAEAMEDEDSYAARLQAILNTHEAVLGAYLQGNDPADGEAVDGWLNNWAEEEVIANEDSKLVSTRGTLTLTAEEARVLWDALREDLANVRIGRRYLLSDTERLENCAYTDLGLTVAYSRIDEEGERNSWTSSYTFTLQRSATSTLKALEELGYGDRVLWRGSGQ